MAVESSPYYVILKLILLPSSSTYKDPILTGGHLDNQEFVVVVHLLSHV